MIKELEKRIYSSIIILPLSLFFLIKGTVYFTFFLTILFFTTSYEWMHMCKKKMIYKVLGIEAARSVLLNEIREVIEASGNYVNYRHLALLCDIMTNKGSLMSIDRFGINRGNIGPLAKCSFEETTDQLFKASMFGEIDLLKGVSSNIMMGQIPPCGTGDSEIILDESKLMDIYPEEEVELDDIDDWVKQDYCEENIGINIKSSALGTDNTVGIPEPEIEL